MTKKSDKKKLFKTIFLLPFLFLIIGMIGCGKETNLQYDNKTNLQYDNKTDIAALKEQELSPEIERLNRPYEIRAALSVVYDMETLKSDGIAEIVRFNQDKFYSVTHVEDGKYLFLLYEEQNEDYYVIDGFLVSTLADKTFFENISKGMKREEILKNDPSSCIFENCSYHRFSDKSMLKIEYTLEDDQYIVSEFQFIKNPVSVLDYLLPEDFDKI